MDTSKQRIKIAVQKTGRLTEHSLHLLERLLQAKRPPSSSRPTPRAGLGGPQARQGPPLRSRPRRPPRGPRARRPGAAPRGKGGGANFFDHISFCLAYLNIHTKFCDSPVGLLSTVHLCSKC